MLFYVIAFFLWGGGGGGVSPERDNYGRCGGFDLRDLIRDDWWGKRDCLAGSRVSLTQPPVGRVHQQFNRKNLITIKKNQIWKDMHG